MKETNPAKGTMNPIYIEFEPAATKLHQQFLAEATVMNLGLIIQKEKKLRVSFYQAIGLDDIYLVIVSCHIDNVLIRLANEYNFPRGFPILWRPGCSMQYFGFYPKFSNDDRQEPDNLTEFDRITGLEFFRKWSGFLGQMIAFEVGSTKGGSQYYWTMTSKNSALNTSPFVRDARRLMEPFVSVKLLESMVRNGLHICAEIMSKNDQTHGTRVLSETPVVTAIGHGQCFSVGTKGAVGSSFVKFFDHEELVGFCMEHKLPCDSAILMRDGGMARKFMLELSKRRDDMNDDALKELLNLFPVEIRKGSVQHSEILGNCLEGLVIKLWSGSEASMKKYKFAGYTIRTMLLREVFKDYILDPDLKKKAQEFVGRWCVSDAGSQYWYRFALEAFIAYDNFVLGDETVGSHIQIAESIEMKGDMQSTIDRFEQAVANSKSVTIIVCVGPIGSGKSTFGAELAAKSAKFVHIDGDVLGLGAAIVETLGRERNDFTLWRITEALMRGQIPIISTGGGAVCSPGQTPTSRIRHFVRSTLGIGCRTILCLPLDQSLSSSDAPQAKSTVKLWDPKLNLTDIYLDQQSVRNSIIERVKRGDWTPDPKLPVEKFAQIISNKSKENAKFCSALALDATYIYSYPRISSQNYGIQKTFDMEQILSNVVYPPDLSAGKFNQLRILVQIDSFCGHITWKYDAKQKIPFSVADFDELRAKYPAQMSGQMIKVQDLSAKYCYQFAIPSEPIHDDKSTHITINCQNHFPQDTRQMALALAEGQPKVQLLLKDNKTTIEYDMEHAVRTPCTIRVLATFGI